MEKSESSRSYIDLRAMEKKYEDYYLCGESEMDMEGDGVDDGKSDVVACCSNIAPFTIVDEEMDLRMMVNSKRGDYEREAKSWLASRQSGQTRLMFMEDLCRSWPEFGIFLEYEKEESAREKRDDVACNSDVVCNSDGELDPVSIRKNPVITKWFLGELSKYWPGFGPADEDESSGG